MQAGRKGKRDPHLKEREREEAVRSGTPVRRVTSLRRGSCVRPPERPRKWTSVVTSGRDSELGEWGVDVGPISVTVTVSLKVTFSRGHSPHHQGSAVSACADTV